MNVAVAHAAVEDFNRYVVGPRLALLGQYFLGYTVTWTGAFVGLLYGFFYGFLFGWSLAYLRNTVMSVYIHLVARRAEADRLKNFLNYI